MVKKSIKYLLYSVLAIFIAIVILMVVIQTPWFSERVKIQTLKYANKELNAYVSIEEIESNWYSKIELNNIELRQKNDSSLISSIASINLKFNLWTLLEKKISIALVDIKEPSLWLDQDSIGNWSIAQIVPLQNDTSKSDSKSFPFTLLIDTINIKHAQIHSKTTIDQLPDSIQNLNLSASLVYKNKYLETKVRHLELMSYSPDLNIKDIKGHFIKDDQRLSLDSLLIHTEKSSFKGHTKYNGLSESNMLLDITPLHKQEVKVFVPSINLPYSPNIKINYQTKGDSTNLQLNLSLKNEIITVSAQILQLEKYTNKQSQSMPFVADISFQNVKPENWWLMDSTQSIINGHIYLSGHHLFSFKNWQRIQAELSNSSYKNHSFEVLNIEARKDADIIRTIIKTKSQLGKISGNIILRNLYSSPNYTADLTIDSLLLSELISEEAGYLNGTASIEGSSFYKDSIQINSELLVSNSNIYGIPIDSALVNVALYNNQLELGESNIYLPGGNFAVTGNYHLLTNSLSANSTFTLDTLAFLNKYELPAISFLSAEGNLMAEGNIDSIESSGVIKLNHFKGFSVSGENIASNIHVKYIRNKLNANAYFNINSIQNGNLHIDSLQGAINYDQDIISAQISAAMDSMHTHLAADIQFEDTTRINISQLEVKTPFSQYYLLDTINKINLHNKDLYVGRIIIKDSLSPSFSINMEGNISSEYSKNFNLDIIDFNLSSLNQLKLINQPIEGLFSTQLVLKGEPQSPLLQSSFNITSGQYGNIQTPDLNGNIKIENNKLESTIAVSNHKKTLNLDFSTPVEFGFDSLKFTFNPSDTFEAQLLVDSLNITNPTNKLTNIQAQGNLKAKINAKGTYSHPLLDGFISLHKGAYSNDQYGIDIQDANITLNFDSNRVSIDTFLIKRDNGYLSMSGQASFDSSMVSGKLHSSTLEAKAKDFYIIKHKDYSALIDANSFYKTIDNHNQFGGKIKVLRSDIYLPAFTESVDDEQLEATPLLVEAISKPDTITSEANRRIKKLKKEESSEFIKTLQGRLQVEIPRNTWIKSDEMKIEIWGDLEVEKSNSYFELYGELGINRGHYILYGKKFVINEGQLTFQGGEQIDPVLNFKATYTYRGPDKEKRKLMLHLTEKLSEPVISFTLDDQPLPEADAISILIMGKTMDELSYSGQNGIAGSIGTEMLAKAVTSQLSKTIGTRFNLDMIEVTATENWQSAAFVVGKYVTNDLFVIYQRGFGETEGDEITPEMIILEYELNRILFFRLQSGSSKDSGFDVILKFESNKD